MGRKIELPIEEIVEKWKNGATQQELADEYGVSKEIIYKRIRQWYKKTGEKKPEKKKKSPNLRIQLPIEEIVTKWESGISLRKLEDEYGVNRETIRLEIDGWYEEQGKTKPENAVKRRGAKRKELPEEEIVAKWKNEATTQELATEYGVSHMTIHKRINEYYRDRGEVKQKKKKNPLTSKIELPIEEIVTKWENGITQEELAVEYGVSHMTIHKRINEYYNSCPSKRNRVLKGITIVIEYLKKGLTPEQIIEIAQKSKVIIPDSVMQEAIKIVQGTSGERTKKDTGRDIDD